MPSITTKFGDVTVDAQAGDRVRVHTNDDQALRINGVDYTINGHAYRHADSTWRLNDEHDSGANWSNPYPRRLGGGEATDAANKALRALVLEVAQEFAETYPDELEAGAEKARAQAIAERDALIDQLTQRVAHLHREVDALKAGGRTMWRKNHAPSGHDDTTQHVVTFDGKVMPAVVALELKGTRYSPYGETRGHVKSVCPEWAATDPGILADFAASGLKV